MRNITLSALPGILTGTGLSYVSQITMTGAQVILLFAFGIILAAQIKMPKDARRIW